MSDSNYTVFNAMTDIVVAPGKAMEAVKEHNKWFWWPLLLSILLPSIIFTWYYSWVDLNWLTEHRISLLPEEAREAGAGENMQAMSSAGVNIGVTVAAIVVMTFLIYLIQSVYLHLATKLTGGGEFRFGQWFSFSAWTAFVGIFGSLAVALVILFADNNQISEGQLAPLSINSLLIHAKEGEPWFQWGNSLSLINIWMLVLMTIGYNRWTGASMVKSAIIVSLPWVLIFGLWAMMI